MTFSCLIIRTRISLEKTTIWNGWEAGPLKPISYFASFLIWIIESERWRNTILEQDVKHIDVMRHTRKKDSLWFFRTLKKKKFCFREQKFGWFFKNWGESNKSGSQIDQETGNLLLIIIYHCSRVFIFRWNWKFFSSIQRDFIAIRN